MPLVLRLAKRILGLPHITILTEPTYGLDGPYHLGSFWYEKNVL
jgi:hypothetical protein